MVNGMELRDFIEQALVDIVEGVKCAQAKTEPGTVAPYCKEDIRPRDVHFEVGIRVENAQGMKGSITVGFAQVLKGDGGGEASTSEGSTTKLTFSVPIRLPFSTAAAK